MLILQGKPRARDLLTLETKTAPPVAAVRGPELDPPWQSIAGFFAYVEGAPMMLFWAGGRRYFRYGSLLVPIDDDVHTTHACAAGTSRFTLSRGSVQLFEITYPDRLYDDDSPLEKEHHDFGLFVHHTLASPVRRAAVGSPLAKDG